MRGAEGGRLSDEFCGSGGRERESVGSRELEGEPVVAGDPDFVDYLALEPNADISAFVNWDRNDLACLEVHHPLMPTAWIRSVKAESRQLANYLAGFEWDQPRHAPVRSSSRPRFPVSEARVGAPVRHCPR